MVGQYSSWQEKEKFKRRVNFTSQKFYIFFFFTFLFQSFQIFYFNFNPSRNINYACQFRFSYFDLYECYLGNANLQFTNIKRIESIQIYNMRSRSIIKHCLFSCVIDFRAEFSRILSEFRRIIAEFQNYLETVP